MGFFVCGVMGRFRYAMKTVTLFLFFSIIFWWSCTDELASGCTDCNATNFNPDAGDDDYLIDIVRDSCDSMGISINNYADITNSLGPLNVIAQIVVDSIYMPYQIIEVPDQDLLTDHMTIFESKGYFKEDSMCLTLYYMDRFDPYFGLLWGKNN